MTAHTSGLRQPPARPPGDSTICHKGLSQFRKVACAISRSLHLRR